MHYISRRLLALFAATAAAATITAAPAPRSRKNQEPTGAAYRNGAIDYAIPTPLFRTPFNYYMAEARPYQQSTPRQEEGTARRYHRPPFVPFRGKAALFKVTAYTPYDEGMNGKGITASGEKVKLGMVAADTKMPFGTIIYIPALDYMNPEHEAMPKKVRAFVEKEKLDGFVKVADRGSMRGNHLDLFVGSSRRFAFEFGVRKLKGYTANDIHTYGEKKRAAN